MLRSLELQHLAGEILCGVGCGKCQVRIRRSSLAISVKTSRTLLVVEKATVVDRCPNAQGLSIFVVLVVPPVCMKAIKITSAKTESRNNGD